MSIKLNKTNKTKKFPATNSPEVIDLLPTLISARGMESRLTELQLSDKLSRKIHSVLHTHNKLDHQKSPCTTLTAEEEGELSTETLILRHKFTNQIFRHKTFQQAALTVIQNIYLFQNRRIFFGSSGNSTEADRQRAIAYLTDQSNNSVPLEDSFQHLILARIWYRIISHASSTLQRTTEFQQLHAIVESLNTIRNIYVSMSLGLVHKLAAHTNQIYNQSLSYEDRVQVGTIGIARAAYRFHSSMRVRFSTYSSKWVQKEIQRQALAGKLMSFSANKFDQLQKLERNETAGNEKQMLTKQLHSCVLTSNTEAYHCTETSTTQPLFPSQQEQLIEQKERAKILTRLIDTKLDPQKADIIKRRFGLPPYTQQEQSIIDISNRYGVTRSSIYQKERSALNKLRKALLTQSIELL